MNKKYQETYVDAVHKHARGVREIYSRIICRRVDSIFKYGGDIRTNNNAKVRKTGIQMGKSDCQFNGFLK